MSLEAYKAVWARSLARTTGQLAVELALADFADDHGHCWPSLATLAKMARLKERQTRQIVSELIELGDLSADRRGGQGVNSRYVLHPGAQVVIPAKAAVDRRVSATEYTAPERSKSAVERRIPGGQAPPNRKEPSTNRQEGTRGRARGPFPITDGEAAPLPLAAKTDDLYRLFEALTGGKADDRERVWLDDLHQQRGRTAVAPVMRRWWFEGKPNGKTLLGWTKHQLRQP